MSTKQKSKSPGRTNYKSGNGPANSDKSGGKKTNTSVSKRVAKVTKTIPKTTSKRKTREQTKQQQSKDKNNNNNQAQSDDNHDNHDVNHASNKDKSDNEEPRIKPKRVKGSSESISEKNKLKTRKPRTTVNKTKRDGPNKAYCALTKSQFDILYGLAGTCGVCNGNILDHRGPLEGLDDDYEDEDYEDDDPAGENEGDDDIESSENERQHGDNLTKADIDLLED